MSLWSQKSAWQSSLPTDPRLSEMSRWGQIMALCEQMSTEQKLR